MEQANKLIVPISIVVAGGLIALGIFFSGNGAAKNADNTAKGIINEAISQPAQPEIVVAKVTKDDHIRGSIDAKVKIIEYSDTECPFCKQYHSILQQVYKEYGDSGKVAWVYRHFPLDMHQRAPKEAEATECAKELGGNDAFWKYTDAVYETTNGNDSLSPTELPKIATRVGLDAAAFNTCLNSGKYTEKVAKDKAAGFDAGARGTPYTVFAVETGGKTEYVPLVDANGDGLGALPFPALKQIIDKLLASN